jgi:hypothetical protein
MQLPTQHNRPPAAADLLSLLPAALLPAALLLLLLLPAHRRNHLHNYYSTAQHQQVSTPLSPLSLLQSRGAV